MTSDSTDYRRYKDIVFDIEGPILDEGDDSVQILSIEEARKLIAAMEHHND